MDEQVAELILEPRHGGLGARARRAHEEAAACEPSSASSRESNTSASLTAGNSQRSVILGRHGEDNGEGRRKEMTSGVHTSLSHREMRLSLEALDNMETQRTLRSELDGGYVGESYIVTCLSKVTE
jgi:hypothetical protein